MSQPNMFPDGATHPLGGKNPYLRTVLFNLSFQHPFHARKPPRAPCCLALHVQAFPVFHLISRPSLASISPLISHFFLSSLPQCVRLILMLGSLCLPSWVLRVLFAPFCLSIFCLLFNQAQVTVFLSLVSWLSLADYSWSGSSQIWSFGEWVLELDEYRQSYDTPTYEPWDMGT